MLPLDGAPVRNVSEGALDHWALQGLGTRHVLG